MWKIFEIIFALLHAFFAFFGHNTPPTPKPSPTQVILVGDSITAVGVQSGWVSCWI